MSQYQMNQLVQKIYKDKYDQHKEAFMEASIAYIKQPGSGCFADVPCLSDVA